MEPAAVASGTVPHCLHAAPAPLSAPQARAADAAGIQFRMLNASKGPAGSVSAGLLLVCCWFACTCAVAGLECMGQRCGMPGRRVGVGCQAQARAGALPPKACRLLAGRGAEGPPVHAGPHTPNRTQCVGPAPKWTECCTSGRCRRCWRARGRAWRWAGKQGGLAVVAWSHAMPGPPPPLRCWKLGWRPTGLRSLTAPAPAPFW